MTVRQLLEGMDSDELTLWIEHSKLEPLDDPYFRTAQTCCAINWAMGGKSKHKDWMPQARKPMTGKQLMSALKAAAGA